MRTNLTGLVNFVTIFAWSYCGSRRSLSLMHRGVGRVIR